MAPEVPVLVVGAGPIGLALSVLLDRLAIPHVVVDRDETTTDHPKSRSCTVRTMEQFRQWGIEQRVRAGGLPGDTDIFWICESITGRVIAQTHPEPTTPHSPTSKCIVAQDVVEESLLSLVEGSRHADLRWATELVELDQDAGSVHARVRDLRTGSESVITAAYAVGCDGAGSRVRKFTGIEMVGPELLAEIANYYYRADLSYLPHILQSAVFFIVPGEGRPGGPILATGPDATRWLWLQPLVNDGDRVLSEDELQDLVRQQTGIPDLAVELINLATWRMTAQVAESFQSGRVFLAGDAAHRFPPTGGQGLNSGVQDVHNLAWKLALVLRGLAGQGLLSTYDTERRPVAQSNTEWSFGNAARQATTQEAITSGDVEYLRRAIIDLDNHVHSEGQAVGFCYETGALIPDGSPPLPYDPRFYWPNDRPGSRFPHMWLDPSHTRSTIDLFDTEFVLVCGPDAHAWRSAADEVAAEGAPVTSTRLPVLAGQYTFAANGAVLVRPDGHVAWHAPAETADPAKELRWALDTILELKEETKR